MPNTPDQAQRMDESADAFMKELQTLIDKFEPEERLAIKRFVDLVEKYYLTAGYKRIFSRAFTARSSMR